MTDTTEALPPLLPCPMCGEAKGYTLSDGSTYRWWDVSCAACGREIGECASDRRAHLGGILPDRWEAADEAWNDAAAHAASLRAALAQRQQAAPSAQAEPVAWGIFDSQGFYEAALDEASARRFCEHYNKRTTDPLKPYRAAPLYAAPPAAQAEPQAPLPFNSAQRRRLWDNSPEIHADAKSFAAFERIVQLVEAARGIGKQEGK